MTCVLDRVGARLIKYRTNLGMPLPRHQVSKNWLIIN